MHFCNVAFSYVIMCSDQVDVVQGEAGYRKAVLHFGRDAGTY